MLKRNSSEGEGDHQKPKRRFIFNEEQKTQLMAAFKFDPYPAVNQMESLAHQLGLQTRTVINWFHNHRMRMRYKNTALGLKPRNLVRSTRVRLHFDTFPNQRENAAFSTASSLEQSQEGEIEMEEEEYEEEKEEEERRKEEETDFDSFYLNYNENIENESESWSEPLMEVQTKQNKSQKRRKPHNPQKLSLALNQISNKQDKSEENL